MATVNDPNIQKNFFKKMTWSVKFFKSLGATPGRPDFFWNSDQVELGRGELAVTSLRKPRC